MHWRIIRDPQDAQSYRESERYRIRQGPYRIVYAVEDDQQVVYVVKIGDGKSVNRAL
jgi:mRNA-degrading endonuclease RelE of RelBE toxin-antitoxin system